MQAQTVAPAPAGQSAQFLTFGIAGEEYALGILQVREIIQYETVTRVPGTPPWIRGVINLRGSVVPVIDVAVKFGLPPSTITPLTCIVVVEADPNGESVVMSLLADSVSQVVELGPADVQPPPSFGTRVKVDYLLGMGRSDGGFVLVLDIDRVLSSDEILAATSIEPALSPEAAVVAPTAPVGEPGAEAAGASRDESSFRATS